MGNSKRILAGITGAAALIVAPFIHNAFSAAAANTPLTDSNPSNSSTSTNSSTATLPTNTVDTNASTDAATADTTNSNKDQGTMPVTVHTEITNGQTIVTVNGESVDVPSSGSINKTVGDNTSTTNISIQTDGSNNSANTTTRTVGGTTHVTSKSSSSVNVSTHTRSTNTTN